MINNFKLYLLSVAVAMISFRSIAASPIFGTTNRNETISKEDVFDSWRSVVKALEGSSYELNLKMESEDGKLIFESKFSSACIAGGFGMLKTREDDKEKIRAVNPDYSFSLASKSNSVRDWEIDKLVVGGDIGRSKSVEYYDSGFFRVVPLIADFSIIDLIDDIPSLDLTFDEVSTEMLEGDECYRILFTLNYAPETQKSALVASMKHSVTGQMWLSKRLKLMPIQVVIDTFKRVSSSESLPSDNQRIYNYQFTYSEEPFLHMIKSISHSKHFDPAGEYTETIDVALSDKRPNKSELYLKHYGFSEPPLAKDPESFGLKLWMLGLLGAGLVGIGYWFRSR